MAKKKKESKDDEKDPRTPVARDGAYVLMLFFTLVAMVAGCVFMYLDHDEYSQKQPPKEPVPAVGKLGAAAPAEPAGGAPAGGAAPAPPAGGMGTMP